MEEATALVARMQAQGGTRGIGDAKRNAPLLTIEVESNAGPSTSATETPALQTGGAA